MFDIKENLKKLPDTPGVYMHKDSLGQVIYVGKAISLRNRVRQYFQTYGKSTPKLRALTSQIAEFEYITCASEMEALILECNLIKRYQPKYNVLLRDDKTYPYIMVTLSERFPRVVKTRELKNDGNKYFGPYSDVGAVNQVVDLLNNTYHLKRCSVTEFRSGHRPCLNYHIGQCLGMCMPLEKDALEGYKRNIDTIVDFLSGRNKEITKSLRESMNRASESMDFEEAAKYRDLLMAAEALSQAQRVTMVSGKDLDVIVTSIKKAEADESIPPFVVLFQVRDGKMIGRETFDFSGETVSVNEGGASDSIDEKKLISEFIKQYYVRWADVPHDILVPVLPEEADLLEEFLAKDLSHKVRISVPKRGENRALILMAEKDTLELVKTLKARKSSDDEKRSALRSEIEYLLEQAGYAGRSENQSRSGIEGGTEAQKDYRVESYDISNTNGVDSVGAMVVFQGNRKVRKDYRRFKIKTVVGPDDYASLEEMLTRRLARAQKGDPAFATLPDIIFMDGGLGQVTSARKAMQATGYDIPVVGLAKDDSHRTRAVVFADGTELDLRERPLLFKYAGTIQEEVHRFAIEYHRGLHGKRAISSVLDEIPGIGEKRRNALLSHFGSVDAIKAASEEELRAVSGMDARAAKSIREFFDKKS